MARAGIAKLAQDPDFRHATSEALESCVRNIEGQFQVLALELRRLQQANGNAASPGESS